MIRKIKRSWKSLNKFGVNKKSDARFLSENNALGKEAVTEEEKILCTTIEGNEAEVDPILKTWYDNELEIIENKKNIKQARK